MELQEITSAIAQNANRDYNGGYFKTLISPEQSGGAFAMIEMVLPKGVEPPLHMHAHEDESFYILEGKMHFQIGDVSTEAGAGAAAFAPRMVPHSFKIVSDQARFITLITPGKLWEFFMEFSTPTVGEPIVTPPQGPPPPEVIERLAQRMSSVYGITFHV